MNIAITGANGFLGYHTTCLLSQQNACIRALFGPATHFDPLLPSLSSIRGDICDPQVVASLVEGADTVLHLAGPPSVAASFENPAEFVRVHGAGTAALLAASVKARIRRFVYVSSAQVYGFPQCEFVSEDQPCRPRSPYAAAKICGEKLVEAYHHAFGLETIVLRPFSIYGRGSSPEAVLNRIIAMARSGAPVLLHDLRPTLDYCFIDDVARALVCACHAPAFGSVFNIGTMRPTSIRELAASAVRLLNSSSKIVEDATHRRPGSNGALRLVADNTRARRELGWSPAVALEEGLRLLLDRT
ncbi:MAG TPA: NAD-dependent epimerase/dehydratase family protein [Bryobacteraceae bacterium]|jgi:UDP-glucose 4-epimerase